MNDALFCSIHVDSSLSRDAMASRVAEWTGGVAVRGGVDCAWGHIAVDDDDGTFRSGQQTLTISLAGRLSSRSCHPIALVAKISCRRWPP